MPDPLTVPAEPAAPASPAARLLPLGDAAWTLQFGSVIDPALHARVIGLARRVEAGRTQEALLAGITDVVPTFRSLTVHFDPLQVEATALGKRLLALAANTDGQALTGRRWRLPVCFDEAFAPDLPRVCELTGLVPAQVIERLLGLPFRVYLLGFLPGFPYMGGWPAELAVPRLPSPRQKVPAQSLAVAGQMCAVYPWASPGGWNLLGRTPVVLFDLQVREAPSMLAAGDEVRWEAVDRATHDALAEAIRRGLPRSHFLVDADTRARADADAKAGAGAEAQKPEAPAGPTAGRPPRGAR